MVTRSSDRDIFRRHVHRAPGRRVPDRVLDQVEQHLPEQLLIAGDLDVARRPGDQRHPTLLGWQPHGALDLVQQFIEIKVVRDDRPIGDVAARERQQVADHPGQAQHLTQDHCQ